MRIFEVKTDAPKIGGGRMEDSYKVAARDAEKAIAKVKQKDNFVDGEFVVSVNLLAATD